MVIAVFPRRESSATLAAAEPLIETSEFTADELLELCARANLVNPLSPGTKS
jgi:hypothetical protein